MKAVLVRVGVDASGGGGNWNGPVECPSLRFAYVAIPETKEVHAGLERPYSHLDTVLALFDQEIPGHLRNRHMHLDPDFERLTYGDQGQRAKQLEALAPGDTVVFYAGLRATDGARLVYALIGKLVVDHILRVSEIDDLDLNAHSRRAAEASADDLVVIGQPEVSGRFSRCIPIGEFRDRAYRVCKDLLDEWGDLTVSNGYIQRSGRLPWFKNPERFLAWLDLQNIELICKNNET